MGRRDIRWDYIFENGELFLVIFNSY